MTQSITGYNRALQAWERWCGNRAALAQNDNCREAMGKGAQTRVLAMVNGIGVLARGDKPQRHFAAIPFHAADEMAAF